MSERVCDGVSDWLAEPDAVCEVVLEDVALPEDVGEKVSVTEAVIELVGVSETVIDGDGDLLCVCDAVIDELDVEDKDGELLWDALDVRVAEDEGVGSCDPEPVIEVDASCEGVPEGVAERDCVPLSVVEGVDELEADDVSLGVGDALLVRLWLALPVSLRLSDCEPVIERDPLKVALRVPEIVGDTLPLEVPEVDGVRDALAVADNDCDGDVVLLGVRVLEVVSEGD